MKTSLFILFFIGFNTLGYSQKGYHVDKDCRIKKYQPEMVDFLISEKWIEDNDEVHHKKDNFLSMFAYKTIEIFTWSGTPKKSGILLVKFGVIGDDIPHYWALLESNSKLFFLNTEIPDKELMDYMNLKKYSKETQDIILHTLKLYKPYEVN